MIKTVEEAYGVNSAHTNEKYQDRETSWLLKSISEDDVEEAIHFIKKPYASGLDCIYASIIKENLTILSPFLHFSETLKN